MIFNGVEPTTCADNCSHDRNRDNGGKVTPTFNPPPRSLPHGVSTQIWPTSPLTEFISLLGWWGLLGWGRSTGRGIQFNIIAFERWRRMMTKNLRFPHDRRSGKDRRINDDRNYFFSGGIERRSGWERRTQGERRKNWIRVDDWSSAWLPHSETTDLSEI